jgi:hypothetical protein
MAIISLCFQGSISGVEVYKATDVNGKEVDISEMGNKELADKLSRGELFVSLRDLLYQGEDEEIEMFDFEGE